jgi:hypothetical protein
LRNIIVVLTSVYYGGVGGGELMIEYVEHLLAEELSISIEIDSD